MAERAISELSPQKLDALIRRLKDRSAPAAPAPIARRPHGEAPLPLSFAQQRFWLLERLDPGSQAYHMPGSARLDGRLDRQALGRALAEIIHRHEVLRTTFREVDGQPVQGVAPTTPFSLPLIDLESLPTPARESEAARILDRLAATPFDLRAGPLLRVVLVRYGQRSHLLLQDQHHIVADGWSLEVFYRELESLYTAFVANESSPLPPLPLQYADFCLWQRQPPDSKVSDSQLDYWRERLAEPLPVLELPSDHPRPPIRTYTGERETRTVSGQLADELKALGASDKGTTLFMVLLAAFAALLSRQSGQADLVIGTPVAGRDRRETEPLIGCFLNLLALRVDLSTRPPFRELLRRVRETALGAYSHQQIAFEQVLETVCPERTLDRTSLFQAFFNMPPPAGGQLELAELVIEPGPAPEGPSGFDLTLYARELAEGGLRFDLVYNADLFDRVRMGETLNQYLTLLAAIANDPEQPIDRYSLLTAGASECLPDPTAALAASWHGAIHERFAENAARAPERCAVVDAEHHWSYGELARQSRGIAAALRSGNVEPGAVVAIYACRSGSLVAALLGVLEAEAVFVVLDPDHPAARLREILHQAEPAALIELAEAGPPPAELETAIDALPTRITLDAAGASSAERGAGSASGRRRRPGDLAYIAFTSGSSGRPRGILGSHGPLSSFLHWYVDRFGHRPDDCFALLSGLSHDPLLRDVFAPLWLGARLEIPDGDQFGEPGWLSGWLARRRVSVVHTTPAMAQQMTSAPLQGVEAPRLSTLRWVFYGGDRLRWEDVARLRQTAPQANCVNFYGATETPQAVAYQIAAMASAAVPRSGPVPLGRGVAEAQLLVLTEAGDLATVGELGEIAVRSRHLALGYLDDEPLTRARFLDSPWGDDSATDELPPDRLYLTGDLGRFRPDGRVEFAGRADRQLKIRGFRIEPAEIEAALERQPGIARAVVIGQEVDENQRLLAYVVGRPRQDGLDSEALRADLGKELPSHMLPGAFVELEQMPLTPNGKVDYAALPAWDSGQLPPDSVAPRSPLEQAIASVWAELLKVEQVGTHQNFFALGGHSLLATRLIARLSSTLGVDLSLQTLFAQPTVSGLAAALEAELQAGRKPPPPLRRRPDRRAPLTFAQQRLWFLDQLEPGNPAYNMPLALDVRGDLDLAALYSCLVALAERQEALKTRFVELTDGPEQRFEPGLQPPLIEIDLGGLPKVRRQDAAHQLCRLLTRRPFDLGHGPLLVAYALRLDPEHHLLLLVSHHIISDGWSSGILVRELAALYQASRDHRTATLSMLPVRYGDYAHWQRGWLQGTVLEAQLDFWRRQLAGAPTTLELPSDRPRPSVLSFRGEELRFELGLELTERLESMSRSRAVTLYMTLLALFETWLGRLSGQGDLLIGTPIANRNRSELEGLIGLFANSLVLRGDLTGDPNFAELLGRVRRRALAAYSHQDLPFEKLVEALQPERDLARNPLFQVMFALQNAPLEAVELPDLTLAPVATGSSTSRFDLTLNLTATGNGLAGRLEYSSELFDRTTIQRWLGNLRDLADGAARHPDRRLSQLPWLPPAERHQLLVEWQRTASEALPTTPVFRWIERQAAATPDASALVFRQGVWSYRELNGRANRLARFLRRLGIRPGTLVGLGLERSPELVVAALGIQKAGGAYLPLDPGYPPERLALMLADSRAEVLVSRSGAHPEIGGETIRRVLIDADAGIDAESPEDLPGGAGLEDTAYVIYTSGSTGRPKGVVISHGALGNFLASMRDQPGLTLADRLLAVTSLSFDIATLELYLPLTVGATIWLADSTEVADGRRLAALIERAGANVLQATPSTWRMLLDAGWHGAPQLRALVGGEALARDLAAELVDRSQTLWNLYGPTETTVWSALHRCAAADGVGEGSVVIGRPIANTAVALLDRRLQPVATGAWGELAIGGDGVARGYLGRPQLTAEVFVPDALTGRPGRRLYRTGDLARVRSAGALEFLGRLDHQLKVRGFRIEPGEIEAALRQHAEVRDAAVVARRLSANAEPSLVGYVVPSSTLDHEALREHLRSLLPAYMVPSVFVALEALPLTPNAKLDRKALPEPAAHRQGLATAYVAPRDETERNLAAIWQEVLGVARVGVDDDFFSLGGHSLMATQLMSRLRERFRVDLPLRQLFETATIAGLAAEVSAAANQAADLALPPLEPEAPGEETPLSFAQERLWFLDKLEPGSTAYQISGLLNFAGPLDQAALERSFCALARRHEILRSSFPTRGGRGVQRLAEPRPVPMPVVDLTALAAEVRDEVARLLAAGQAARGFDLTRGPLLRLLLLRLEPQRHLALVVLHHIVADAWSLGLFAREIVALYDAFSNGRPSPLAGLPVQYADYARWQRRWLRDDLLDEQLDYWRQRLEGGRLPPIELPTDRPRPAIQSYRGGSCTCVLPKAQLEQLEAVGRANGATLFMTLLAALATLLHRYAGQADVVIGAPVAGRRHPHLESLIGLFVNTLPMRVSFAGSPRFASLLEAVRAGALGDYAHQDLPFEKLVEALQPERHLSRHPLFDVMLNLLNTPSTGSEPGELAIELEEPLANESKFSLTLTAQVAADELELRLVYQAALFSPQRAASILDQYKRLLSQIGAAPERSIDDYSLVGSEDRVWLPDPAAPLPAPKYSPVPQLVAEQAARRPDASAVTLAGHVYSYRELATRAEGLARQLVAGGLRRGETVAVCGEPSFGLIVAMCGVLASGGVLLLIDPQLPAPRRRRISAAADVACRIELSSANAETSAESEGTLAVDPLSGICDGPIDNTVDLPALTGEEAAYIFFTSGSSGRPKGVRGLHRGLSQFLDWQRQRFAISTSDRVAQLVSLSFDAVLRDVFLPLTNGATLCLPSTNAALQVVPWLANERVTVVHTLPAVLRSWLVHPAEGLSLSDLRWLFCSGEPLDGELVRRWRAAFPGAGSVVNLYGPTETTMTKTFFVAPPEPEPGVLPVGRAIDHAQALVLGPGDRLRGVNEAGEIVLRTPFGTAGYLDAAEGTQAFVPNPFRDDPADVLYRTGDRGRYRPDGELEILGRLDAQIKVRGVRIEPEEVETVLERHPDVAQAAVGARPDKSGVKRLIAWVVARRRFDALAGELRQAAAAELPPPLVPSEFVWVENLPLTATGKIDRRALPEPGAAEPAIRAALPVSPRSDLERKIAAIWQRTLEREEVGVHDNFFDLGGHSLRLVEVQSRLRHELGRELSMLELFQHPTIAALAGHLAADTEAIEQKSTRRSPTATADGRIAIVGFAGRFPGARDPELFWQNLRLGVESITAFSDEDLLTAGVLPEVLERPNYVRAGSVLDDVELFDAGFFGFNPREAQILDPQHRLLLECAWDALERAGYEPRQYDGRIGVFAGVHRSTYLLHLLADQEIVETVDDSRLKHATDKDYLATRVSYKLDLSGPSFTVQTTCSTSLVATHLACRSLLAGECEMALAGGVSVRLPQVQGYLRSTGGILSPDGHCRAFDARGQGTIFTNGLGLVVLKRLEDALADGDAVHAVILGTAINNDGGGKIGYTAPSIDGQSAVIRAAHEAAGVDPATISYVEAHGTATPLGDPIEVEALTQAFRAHTDRRGFCALGSVKSNIGHLDTAAGIAGLIKTTLALENAELPPSLHFTEPNPEIDFAASPFYVNTELRPWPRGETPRRAGVSSFGIGGTNAHAVIEEGPEAEPSGPAHPWQLLVLSARSAPALEAATQSLAEHLAGMPSSGPRALADVAFTLQVGRRRFAQRRILVADSAAQAAAVLSDAGSPETLSLHDAGERRPVAFLFPGQGAQYVEMGQELYRCEPLFRQQLDRLSQLFEPHLGLDLRRLIYPSQPASEAAALRRTDAAQPALFAIEYALARLWLHWGVEPAAMLGHSIGEYVAASLADVLPLEQAVMLVAKRGQLMAGLPEGAMLSAALPANELESLLGHELSLAADNGPSLSVASGPTEAIARLADTLASRDVEHRQLHTSHAFHSAMVEPILGPFGELLAKCDLQPPQRRYVSNVTGDWIRDSEATDPAYWVRHLRHTVRFRDGLGRLLEEPQLALLEVGPGRALGTLARRHPAAERGRVVVSAMPHARDKRPDLMVALTALGRLWLAGAEIDWQSLHIGRRRRTVLPTYPFERQRYWVEAPAAGMATLLPSGAGWSRAPLGEAGGDLTGPWLVFVDRAGLGRRLVERLTAAGETVWTVASSDSFAADHEAGYRLEPRQIDGYQMLWSDLSRRGIAPQRIVHLWSFGDDADASSIGGLSLMHLAAMLGGHKVDSLRLDVVTSGASRLADEAPSDPGRAGIAGICEVSGAALPGVMVSTVDLSTAVAPEALETLAEQLVAELRSSAAATQAVWRNGERWQLAANPSDTETLPGLDEPAPLPEAADRPPLETSYVAPRGATEEALAALWQKLLGIGRVGIHDDFFDLGGHSLLATQVLTRVRETFAAEIPLDTFFETPTVAGLAARLDAAESVDTALAPIEPVPRTEGPLLLSFAQQRMWFLHQLDPVSTAYHLPFAVRLEGALDPVALYHSLAEVVRRHEVLRTVFVEVDGEPRQDIIATRSLTLPFVDLSVVTATQRETVAQQLAQELIGEPFRLDHGSLLRVLLLALDASRHVLVGVMHHIVSDGWSTALLTREVATLYHAYHGGQPSPLAELPIQYADFAMWQQRWLESEAAVEQLDYWRQQLGGEPPALALPADRPRPEHQSFRGGRCFLELDAELTGRLRALGRRRSTSLFVTLLTAWKGLLARYTGQRDIAVGTPVANRRWGEIESLIGFFANTLVLRTDLGRDRDFLSLLERVRNVCMGGFAHQDLPFDKLVEVLAPERDTSRQALFQVMFGLQNMPAEDLELPGLVLTPFELEIDSAPFDLTLLLEERDGLLRGALRYSTDLFDEATAAQLIHHYEVLLRRVEATPERPLSTLALLRHQEELQLCQADRPAGASAIYVLDGSLHAVPVGMIGELYIASEGPPVGSLEAGTEAGTETAQQWPNPFSTEAGGWLQRVGERGRRLRDGRLWIAGPVEEAAILAGLRLDCEAIRQVLLADPAIVDCALARRYHQQDARLLAYVVASGPLPVDRLRARLAERFPAAALPAAWVPVTTLPLTADGEVDMEALGRLEILDETVAERWQQRLATLPGVDDDAVVVRQRAHPIARQHLSDLLPDWSPIPVADATGGVKESVDEPSASSTATESARPAISHGDPLDRPADDVTTLQAALLRAAATSPEVGLVQLEGDGTEHLLPYADLPAAASRVLAGLRRLGLRAGDPVIFQLQRAHEFLLTFWGCQLGGMVPVPVAIPAGYEDNTAAGKLGDVWQMLDRPPIVTDTASGPAIHALLADDQAEAPRVVEIEALRRNEQDSEWHRAVPQEPAVMFLTSGSTGLPKGVPQSHAALLSMAAGTRQMNGFGSHDTSLNWMPLDHVGAVSFLHVLPLYLCCQQVHAPTASILQEPLRWLDWIERHRATISWAPNFAFALINDRAEEIGGRRWDLSSLGFLVNAGEAVSARAVRRFLDLLGRQGLPDNALRPAFGMSETCSGITWSSGFSLADSSDDLRFVELGRPIPGAALRIVDEAGKVVETNSVGQLQAMGPSVLAGYYNNPEANSEALVGDGWFNTGDLGLLDEHGRLVITGREKDVIIVRGVSLYCQEIESVVDEIPAVEVSFTAACALYDATIGADRLAIFFNTQENDEDRLAELIREIRGRVNQAIGANPDYLLPVRRDEIPKTSIGKIQRAQLIERLRQGAFDSVLKRMDLLLANAKTLPGWFFRRVWRQRQLVHRSASHGRAVRGRTLILADRLGLGEVIAGRLGTSAVCLAAGEDYRPRLAELDPETDRVLDLRTYGGGVGSPWDEAELEQAQESAAYGLLQLVQSLAGVGRGAEGGETAPLELLVVSSHAQDLDAKNGDEGAAAGDMPEPEKAPLLGLLKTAAQEIPELNCRHLDLPAERIEEDAQRVLRELAAESPEIEVAYRRGRRLVPRLEPVTLNRESAQPLPFRQRGLYLISGGLGGIGTRLARELLVRFEARLVLVGRTPLPKDGEPASPAVSERLEALRSLAGLGKGDVIYEAVDVADREALERRVAEAEARWGQQLDGVVHLAGVARPTALVDETPAGLAAALRPKMAGTRALHRLLEARGGGVFIAFASVNGVFGGRGVAAYSAADAFVQRFTQASAGRTPVRSYCFAWSLWDEVGMSRNNPLKEASVARGYLPIGAESGINSWLAGLHCGEQQLIIGLDGGNPHIQTQVEAPAQTTVALTAYLTMAGSRPLPASSGLAVHDPFGGETTCELVAIATMPRTADGEIDHQALENLAGAGSGQAGYRAPSSEVERRLAALWREVLEVERVGLDDSFFDLGGHSLLATQLLARMHGAFGIEVPLRQLFERPTIAGQASLIEEHGAGMPGMSTAPEIVPAIEPLERRASTEAEALLERLDELSNEEVTALLAERAALGEIEV